MQRGASLPCRPGAPSYLTWMAPSSHLFRMTFPSIQKLLTLKTLPLNFILRGGVSEGACIYASAGQIEGICIVSIYWVS